MSEIRKIHDLLESKQISCKELTEKYLTEIDKSNSELNAYVNVTADAALANHLLFKDFDRLQAYL